MARARRGEREECWCIISNKDKSQWQKDNKRDGEMREQEDESKSLHDTPASD